MNKTWIRKNFNAKFKLQLLPTWGWRDFYVPDDTCLLRNKSSSSGVSLINFLKDLKIAQHDGTKVGRWRCLFKNSHLFIGFCRIKVLKIADICSWNVIPKSVILHCCKPDTEPLCKSSTITLVLVVSSAAPVAFEFCMSWVNFCHKTSWGEESPLVFVFLWGLVVMDAALNLYLLRVGGGVLLC